MINDEVHLDKKNYDDNRHITYKFDNISISNIAPSSRNKTLKSLLHESHIISPTSRINSKINYNSNREFHIDLDKNSVFEKNLSPNLMQSNSTLANSNILQKISPLRNKPNQEKNIYGINNLKKNIKNNLPAKSNKHLNNSKFTTLNTTESNLTKINQNTTNDEYSNLFKLSNDLNLHMQSQESLRQKSLQDKNFRSSLNMRFNKYFNTTNNYSNYNSSSHILKKSSNFKNSLHAKSVSDFDNINLDKYNSIVTQTMTNYRTESLPIDINNQEQINEIINTQNKNLGIPIFKKNQNSSKSINNFNITYGENSYIKIDIKNKDYSNPFDSERILNTNKSIYNDISSSLINLQKIYYDNTINKIDRFQEFKRKMCKVRVSNMMPKNSADILSLLKSKGSGISDKSLNLSNPILNNSKNLTGFLKKTIGEHINHNIYNSKNNVIYKPNESPIINPNKDRSSESREKLRILEKEKEKERLREQEKEKRKNKNKKKKEDIKMKNKIIRPDELELYAYYKDSTKYFPEGREQFALDFSLSEIILYGGIVPNKNNNIWSLDPISLEWQKKKSENIPSYPRYGHTGIIYHKKFYVFGGKFKLHNYHYMADLDIYDLTENHWITPNISTKKFLELRRNHVADLIGNQMIIHGGMNEDNKILNDVYALSMSPPLKWHQLNISDFITGPALASHASALVIPMEIKFSEKTSIYKFPENGIGKLNWNKIREKGWYLFGGINSDDGALSNDLWVLRLGRKPLEWIKPIVKGKPPIPRYLHTLNYYEEGNFLICHGGRNDLKSQCSALNDTHIFDLSKMEWQEIKLYSDSDKFSAYNRCGHNSVIFSDKLIIFGGMNNMNYLGSSLFIINLDFYFQYENEDQNEVIIENLKKKGKEKIKNLKDESDNISKDQSELPYIPLK